MRDYQKSGEVLQPLSDMQKVVDHIFENYEQKISLNELADCACLSVSQLIRNFKKVFRATPQQFLLKVRLDAACQMLVSTDLTISQIAQRTGFYDHSHFAKQFTENKQMSPKRYRKRYIEHAHHIPTNLKRPLKI
jgi:transcriptional regulator GlxA family with amidase domain